eukprot:TRINITY_DN10104_c0_g1_i1.p1 TRINITY_DN10104_c0_g1~~TRINITY_DN10104_c0_g1_i1.p1  ORF type:complete len:565 (-),score=86.83 TRINITY_DN10104_c0_g1_i1:86-1699(-)
MDECYLVQETDAGDGAEGGDASQGNGGVNILVQGSVGPFDFKVLQAGNGTLLFDWLNDNGYDQPDGAMTPINYYADMGFVFVALKLLKDKSVGDLQPIVVEYALSDAISCVPLVITAIAADPELPIYIWILGESRAVPINYFSFELDETQWDWLGSCGNVEIIDYPGFRPQCTDEYFDQIIDAATVANGHGFVTEYAGTPQFLDGEIYPGNIRFDREKLLLSETPGQLLDEMLLQQIPRSDLVQEIIKRSIPKPDDADLPEECKGESAFYNTFNIDECAKHIDGWCFRTDLIVSDLERRFIEPLQEAQMLFNSSQYLTRLFTIMESPDWMSKDPLFRFHTNEPDVPLIRQVTAMEENCGAVVGDSISMDVTLVYSNGATEEWTGNKTCYSNDFVRKGPGVGPLGPHLFYYETLDNRGAVSVNIQSDDIKIVESSLDALAMPTCDLNLTVTCSDGFMAEPHGPFCGTVCPDALNLSSPSCDDCDLHPYVCDGHDEYNGDGDEFPKWALGIIVVVVFALLCVGVIIMLVVTIILTKGDV